MAEHNTTLEPNNQRPSEEEIFVTLRSGEIRSITRAELERLEQLRGETYERRVLLSPTIPIGTTDVTPPTGPTQIREAPRPGFIKTTASEFKGGLKQVMEGLNLSTPGDPGGLVDRLKQQALFPADVAMRGLGALRAATSPITGGLTKIGEVIERVLINNGFEPDEAKDVAMVTSFGVGLAVPGKVVTFPARVASRTLSGIAANLPGVSRVTSGLIKAFSSSAPTSAGSALTVENTAGRLIHKLARTKATNAEVLLRAGKRISKDASIAREALKKEAQDIIEGGLRGIPDSATVSTKPFIDSITEALKATGFTGPGGRSFATATQRKAAAVRKELRDPKGIIIIGGKSKKASPVVGGEKPKPNVSTLLNDLKDEVGEIPEITARQLDNLRQGLNRTFTILKNKGESVDKKVFALTRRGIDDTLKQFKRFYEKQVDEIDKGIGAFRKFFDSFEPKGFLDELRSLPPSKVLNKVKGATVEDMVLLRRVVGPKAAEALFDDVIEAAHRNAWNVGTGKWELGQYLKLIGDEQSVLKFKALDPTRMTAFNATRNALQKAQNALTQIPSGSSPFLFSRGIINITAGALQFNPAKVIAGAHIIIAPRSFAAVASRTIGAKLMVDAMNVTPGTAKAVVLTAKMTAAIRAAEIQRAREPLPPGQVSIGKQLIPPNPIELLPGGIQGALPESIKPLLDRGIGLIQQGVEKGARIRTGKHFRSF